MVASKVLSAHPCRPLFRWLLYDWSGGSDRGGVATSGAASVDSNNRCGRWRDHHPVVNGILHRVRTGVQRRDLPERYGPWKTVYERHRRWSADGTWERLLQQVQAQADATGGIGLGRLG